MLQLLEFHVLNFGKYFPWETEFLVLNSHCVNYIPGPLTVNFSSYTMNIDTSAEVNI
jgi:hypothetical protein